MGNSSAKGSPGDRPQEVGEQEVTDVDVLDIVETFTFPDLEDVCIRLGLTRRDIINTKLGDPLSPKKQAQNILHLWRDRNGMKATRIALIKAMEKCPDCKALIDTLKRKWNMTFDGPSTSRKTEMEATKPAFDGPSTSVERKMESKPGVSKPSYTESLLPKSLECFRKELKEYYQDEMGQLPLLPWLEDHETKHIDDIFVDLELATKERMNEKPEKLQKYEDLVILRHPTQKDKFATRVLVLGDAGSGKTSLMSKIAYSWSQDHQSLAQFELVFYLELRNLDTKRSLLDEILETREFRVDPNELQLYIYYNPRKILILLDGWDESDLKVADIDEKNTKLGRPEYDIANLINRKKQASSCVIVTSRPYKYMGNVQEKYSAVNLRGFSDKNVKEYIRKFFQKKDEEEESENVSDKESESKIERESKENNEWEGVVANEARALYNRLKSADTLSDLAKIPLMLMLICWMWSDPEIHDLPKQQTELYYQFVCAIWKRYRDKYNVDNNSENEDAEKLENDMKNTLNKLGKVAFDGISADILVFKKNKIQPMADIGLRFGLLIPWEKVKSRHNVSENNKSIIFLHKSFQEYCAAYFLVNNPDVLGNFLESLDNWDAVLSKQEVLLFCCGLCSMFPGKNYVAINIIRHAMACCVRYGTENNYYEIEVGYQRYIAAKYNILPVLNLLNECGNLNHKALIKPFRDLIMFNTLRIFNTNPQTLPIFHQVVTSKLGSSLCNIIQDIRFGEVTCASLGVISDTLRRMQSVSYVNIIFSHDDTCVASDTSMTQLGESIAALSKLSRLDVVYARNRLDISVILHHLSQSPRKTLTCIHFNRTHVGDAISHMGCFIPHLTSLSLWDAALEDRHITVLCDFLPNATCLTHLDTSNNYSIGNNGLHTLFTHIHHCARMRDLLIGATIDCRCSPLVKKCVAATSHRYEANRYIPTGKAIPVEACRIDLSYHSDNTQSVLSISRNAATKIH